MLEGCCENWTGSIEGTTQRKTRLLTLALDSDGGAAVLHGLLGILHLEHAAVRTELSARVVVLWYRDCGGARVRVRGWIELGKGWHVEGSRSAALKPLL